MFVDEKHDLLLMSSTQGSIILLTLTKLPFSTDLDPPSPRGILPVDGNSLIDILPVYWTDLEEAKRQAQVLINSIRKI